MAPQQNNIETEPVSIEVSIKKEIYYDGYMYDVTEWIPNHPGGKIINFYTEPEEDATIPIQQFHQRSIKRVLAKLKTFPKRPATILANCQDQETARRHQKLTEDFQELYKDLMEKGYFVPSLFHTFLRFAEIFTYLCLGIFFLQNPHIFMSKSLTFFFMVLYFTRSGFLQHEGGHASLTGYPTFDKYLEAVALTFGMGLSSTWWSSQHNRHHAMPQRMHRDVDLETLPLIAFNAKVAADKKSGNNFFTRNQAKLFLLIDTLLVGITWKLYVIPRYLMWKRQYSQIALLVAHYVFLIAIFGFKFYFFSQWATSIFLLGTFSMSHTHMPVTTEKLHWVEYSLLHTTNVTPSWWCDWAMGYLNYQIEHHLFPTMPNFRQRDMAWRVKELAKKNGLKYNCISYTEAITEAFKNLAHVSEEIVATQKKSD